MVLAVRSKQNTTEQTKNLLSSIAYQIEMCAFVRILSSNYI